MQTNRNFLTINLNYLNAKLIVEYKAAVDSLQSASETSHLPETIEFLEKYLLKMLSIMLQQNSSILGHSEKSSINQSLSCATLALLQLP